MGVTSDAPTSVSLTAMRILLVCMRGVAVIVQGISLTIVGDGIINLTAGTTVAPG